jgi:beta-glucosidase
MISRMNLPKRLACLLLSAGLFATGSTVAQTQNACSAWMNKSLTPDERTRVLLSHMSQDQKLQMIAGSFPWTCCGNASINPIPALCIPPMIYCDGSVGVGNQTGQAVQLGSSQANAATFDPELWYKFGLVIGRENWNRGCSVSLGGNSNNSGREPRDGRTFEQKGEDVILTGAVDIQQTRAIQSQNVIAGLKHYAFNDQETNRVGALATITERNARESDLIPFEMAVKKAELGSIMCAYNKINTIYSCEQPHFLNEVVREDWGFKGLIESDWWVATRSTVASMNAGLDQEMPFPNFFTPANVSAAISAGQVSQSTLDGMVSRVLRTMFAVGVFDNPPTAIPNYLPLPAEVIKEDTAIAQANEEQGAVLLHNAALSGLRLCKPRVDDSATAGDRCHGTSALPLNASTVDSIAIIGSNADCCTLFGGGSSEVLPIGGAKTFTGEPGIWIQNSPLTAIQAVAAGATITYDPGTSLRSASSVAAAAKVAIVFVNQFEEEGSDLTTLALPNFQGISQDSLVKAVAEANPYTIVVVENGSPVFMPWLSSVAAVLEAWYPGQAGAQAIANLLFGKVNPSGKLPLTFPSSLSQLPRPVIPNGLTDPVDYNIEGYKVGYKWYDSRQLTPLFPFGFGLSYTSFSFSDLRVSVSNRWKQQLEVRFNVTNTGRVSGSEVGQVYLRLPQSTGEPNRLVSWRKVKLNPGETQHVGLMIDPQDASHPLSFWGNYGWEIADGTYEVYVGDSSANLPLAATTEIHGWRDYDLK